ncbi:hypothetical protein CCACVL1_13049 [Corchorus capsularis]|uniref:Pentacotripeptide-repeat region of PRORP domain-containing protein n=1 Tax=Corchorus capsularis TaxID=210143 RepID=A0A1R3ICH9_COCAP|nr:hypothetical protein CCACVL1_13049 [Corchorus capsularis]
MASRALIKIFNHSKTSLTGIRIILARTYWSTENPVTRDDLYFRINAVTDPHCSVTPVLQKWIEGRSHVKESELRRIIRSLRSRRRYSHALEVSQWMSSNGSRFSSGDSAVQLDLIGRVHGLISAKSFFYSLKEEDKSVQTYSALLNCYVQEGLVDEALSLVKKMKEMGFLTSPLPYNDIMCLYTKTGQHEKVPDVLSEMKRNGVSPDIFSYRVCMNSYGARADYNSMGKVLEEMNSRRDIKRDWLTYSVVANYYIKGGLKEMGIYYLKECEKLCKTAEGFNFLISSYATLGIKDEMERLWALQKVKCKKHVNRDYMTGLSSLVKLGELEEAESLLEEWELSCTTFDFRVPNALLIGYCQRGLVEKAEAKLQDIIKRRKTANPSSWSIIATGYAYNNNMEKAFECFNEALAVQAENRDWKPKESLISSILSWLGENGEIEDAEAFVNSLKSKVPINREMYHALLKAYVRNGREVEGLLESMKNDKIDEDEETMKIISLQK